MPSARPFPGIDPYLESQGYWPDFHNRFINYCCEAIADRLPDDYEARIDERVRLVELPPEEVARLYRPDVAVTRRGVPSSSAEVSAEASTATMTADAPVTLPLAMLDETRESFIEILHRPERSLVTVIELLSPSNKVEPGYGEYVARRMALLRQPVHVIDLDLLTRGYRLRLARPLPVADYYALVARSDHRPDCSVYAWTVHRPLPTIAIPLRATDPDIRLDLGAVVATAYERGRYARSIDYAAPLGETVALRPEDRAWAEGRAREAHR